MTTTSLKNRVQNQAYQLVLWQLISVLIITVLTGLSVGITPAYSVLAGGYAYGLPNLFFVWCVFRFAGATQMNQFISAFFIFEMFKLILSGFLFLMIVKYLPVSLLSVLIGFTGAIISFWIVSMCQFAKKTNVVQAA